MKAVNYYHKALYCGYCTALDQPLLIPDSSCHFETWSESESVQRVRTFTSSIIKEKTEIKYKIFQRVFLKAT